MTKSLKTIDSSCLPPRDKFGDKRDYSQPWFIVSQAKYSMSDGSSSTSEDKNSKKWKVSWNINWFHIGKGQLKKYSISSKNSILQLSIVFMFWLLIWCKKKKWSHVMFQNSFWHITTTKFLLNLFGLNYMMLQM